MELQLLQWLQSLHSPAADTLMQLVTMLGESVFIAAVMMVVYYAVDKKAGEEAIAMLGFSLLINIGIKELLRFPRPIGAKGIRSLRVHTATGFSFPSGHTQAFATLIFALRAKLHRGVLLIGALVIGLVAYSRLYLGVHWPKDVLFGVAFAWLSVYVVQRLLTRISHTSLMWLIVILLHLLVLATNAHDAYKIAGIMLGCCIGFIIEKRWICFENTAVTKNKVLRILGGICTLLAVYAGLKQVLPSHILFDYLRYFLVGFTAVGVYPLVIKIFFSA